MRKRYLIIFREETGRGTEELSREELEGIQKNTNVRVRNIVDKTIPTVPESGE